MAMEHRRLTRTRMYTLRTEKGELVFHISQRILQSWECGVLAREMVERTIVHGDLPMHIKEATTIAFAAQDYVLAKDIIESYCRRLPGGVIEPELP